MALLKSPMRWEKPQVATETSLHQPSELHCGSGNGSEPCQAPDPLVGQEQWGLGQVPWVCL